MTSGTSLFVYGTLRHLPLLEVVLGHLPQHRPAWLRDHSVKVIAGENYPTLCPEQGLNAEGLLLEDISDDDRSRLNFYEGSSHYALHPVTICTDAGLVVTEVYSPTDAQPEPAGPWDLPEWVAAYGEMTTLAVREAMAQIDRMTADEVRARYAQMLVRASSAVRAATEPVPASIRTAMSADDVEVLVEERPYTEYFGVAEQDLRFPLFAGGMSDAVRRAAFITGDAVTVLPYDPGRDRVLLIEQFRFGPYMRGDPLPWALEPIAGRIDPGETPEDAARREAHEEARVEIGALHLIGRYYPSPGAIAEWLVSYIGIADLPDEAAVIAGEASEAEDILGHVVPFARLLDLTASGEAAVGPLLLSAQWLQLHRERLRGVA